MAKGDLKTTYFIESYVRCGEMPLFYLFCRDKKGRKQYCVMLCQFRQLRQLLRKRKGFNNPGEYGRVLFTGHGSEPADSIREMLKERYDFDLSSFPRNDLYTP